MIPNVPQVDLSIRENPEDQSSQHEPIIAQEYLHGSFFLAQVRVIFHDAAI